MPCASGRRRWVLPLLEKLTDEDVGRCGWGGEEDFKKRLFMKIYLDVCCLNRPFDDHMQDRIRIESEAILAILGYCHSSKWFLLSSEVVDLEISKIPDDYRRQKVAILSTVSYSKVRIDKKVEQRALELENIGFKPIDALHIACAEKGKADVLLTTDDALCNSALKYNNLLKVRVENPLKWLMEVIKL